MTVSPTARRVVLVGGSGVMSLPSGADVRHSGLSGIGARYMSPLYDQYNRSHGENWAALAGAGFDDHTMLCPGFMVDAPGDMETAPPYVLEPGGCTAFRSQSSSSLLTPLARGQAGAAGHQRPRFRRRGRAGCQLRRGGARLSAGAARGGRGRSLARPAGWHRVRDRLLAAFCPRPAAVPHPRSAPRGVGWAARLSVQRKG